MNNYIHYWSGVEKSERAGSGVSILTKNCLIKFIKDYDFVSDRIVTATLKIYGHEIVIVGVYAPYDTSGIQIKDLFYEELSSVISKIKPHQDIIIAGDLNANVMSREDDDVVGKFAQNVENDSDKRLIEIYKNIN